MIVEFFMGILIKLVEGVMSVVQIQSLPLQGIQVLADFCSVGAYIVGADLLLLFASVVFMWMVIKLQFGLVLFIWRLLPLT